MRLNFPESSAKKKKNKIFIASRNSLHSWLNKYINFQKNVMKLNKYLYTTWIHKHNLRICKFSYRASDHTHILRVLLKPIVHVLTHSKQVVKARGLPGWPIAFGHLKREMSGHSWNGNMKQKVLKEKLLIQVNKKTCYRSHTATLKPKKYHRANDNMLGLLIKVYLISA